MYVSIALCEEMSQGDSTALAAARCGLERCHAGGAW